MSRSYTFKNSAGEILVMGLQEAAKLVSDPAIKSRFEQIIDNSKNVRRVRDGFSAGWQENIQAYAGGPAEYAAILKEKGLVEIGKDYIPQESQGNLDFCKSEEFIQECLNQGVELSGNEQAAIKTGEYFDNVEIAE